MRTDFRTTAPATIYMAMLLPACWTSLAHAQAGSSSAANAAAQQRAPDSLEEVVVTGTRVIRDGFQSPTPTTVLSGDDLQAAATITVAEALNQLPSFTGSSTSRTNNVAGSTGVVGVNTLNLRSLGNNRTLVLIDGQRAAGSDGGGALDINIVPSGLIERVDVVTGGASAAYGSDAVGGVVNFILDHDYTGVKLNLEGGVTTYGDDEAYKGTVTYGAPFADGRGHVLAYGEYAHNAGIDGRDRPWEHSGYQTVFNPAYGTAAGLSTSVPQLLVRRSVGLANAAPGGLITAGPLAGTAFGPGGSVVPLNYGTLVAGGQMIGGDWQRTNIDDLTNLDVRQTSERVFTRVGFDLTDAINVYAGAQWSRTDSYNTNGSTQFYRANLTVSPTNPFLPASVRAAALAAGITTPMTFGTTNFDIGSPDPATIRTLTRYSVGADGNFTLLGKPWTLNAHFQNSQMKIQNRVFNVINSTNLRQALDAIVGPTGAIVCRNPANGCVPHNAFGTGVASAASIAFVTGTSSGIQYIKQSSAEASIAGEPFSSWAGPVSLAVGVDWRKDSANGTSSALDQQRVFFYGNFSPDNVDQSVKEAFAETVVPLAKDYTWARSLDLNGAVRFTDYSLAGRVTTWKIGATYTPVDTVMLRATRSRDIRAPSLTEISPALRSTSGGVTDPLRNNEFVSILALTGGNPGLKPEIGDTLGIGAVVSPSFIPRLTLSADYFDIKISDAISGIVAAQVVQQCSNGNRPELCRFITRGPPAAGQSVGPITAVQSSPVNIAALQTRGYDFEAGYTVPVSRWNGNVVIRALATNVIQFTNFNLAGTIQSAGSMNAPSWKYNASVALALPRNQLKLTMRGVSSNKIDATWVTCTSGCPIATGANPTSDYNRVDAWRNFDFSVNHKMTVAGAEMDAYFVVQNIFNTAPPPIPGALSSPGFFQGSARPSYYDAIGRFFHLGVRMDF